MRQALILCVLLASGESSSGMTADVYRPENPSYLESDSPAYIAHASCISSDDRTVSLEISLEPNGGLHKYSRIPVPVGMIAVPPTGRISARVVDIDAVLSTASGGDDSMDDIPCPEDILILDGPSVWRELRVVSLLVKPCWETEGTRFRLNHARIVVENIGGRGEAEKTVPMRPISPMWERIYSSNILNYDALNVPRLEYGTGNRYIIISRARFDEQVPPFAAWKTQQGYGAVIVTLEELGYTNPTSRDAINATKRYIMEAYTSWDVPPEFVILVGDMYDAVPSGSLYSKQFWDILGFDPLLRYYDQWYALLDGPDLLPDVMLGRFPDTNVIRLDYLFNKSIGYEMYPYIEGEWQKRAIMTAMHSNPGHITIRTKQTISDSLDAWGMNVKERYNMGSASVIPLINQGVSFYNYRGEWCSETDWGGTFGFWDVPYVYNVNKLGVWTVLSCSSADIVYSYPSTAELMLRLGYNDPSHPRGAVAFVGSQAFSWYYYNNALDVGFYRAFVSEGATLLGEAFVSGKAYAYANTTPSDSQRVMLREYTILGDPSLQIWTDVPTALSVVLDAESIIPDVESFVTVTVGDSATSNPIEAALVCFHREPDVYVYGYTDADGIVALPLSPQSGNPDEPIELTVTSRNSIPFYGHLPVTGAVRPPPPEVVAIREGENRTIFLHWKLVEAADITYEVYILPDPYESPSPEYLLESTTASQISIPISSIPGPSAYFRIVGRNACGVPSQPSNPVGIGRFVLQKHDVSSNGVTLSAVSRPLDLE